MKDSVSLSAVRPTRRLAKLGHADCKAQPAVAVRLAGTQAVN